MSAALLSSLKFKVKSLKCEEFRRYSRVVTLSAEAVVGLSAAQCPVIGLSVFVDLLGPVLPVTKRPVRFCDPDRSKMEWSFKDRPSTYRILVEPNLAVRMGQLEGFDCTGGQVGIEAGKFLQVGDAVQLLEGPQVGAGHVKFLQGDKSLESLQVFGVCT